MSQPVAIMSNNNYICCIISVINKQRNFYSRDRLRVTVTTTRLRTWTNL